MWPETVAILLAEGPDKFLEQLLGDNTLSKHVVPADLYYIVLGLL